MPRFLSRSTIAGMNTHTFSFRVFFEDIDMQGIVHHSNYVKFFERARTEFFNDLGFSLHRVMDDLSVQFVIRGINIKYQKPARFEDQLTIESKIAKIGRAKLTFHQTVYSKWYEDKISLCTAEVEMVCVNLQKKVASLPEILTKELNRAS